MKKQINKNMSTDKMLSTLKHRNAFKGVQYDIVFTHPTYGLVALSLAENDMNDSWMWWLTSKIDNRMFTHVSPEECQTAVNNIKKRYRDAIIVNTFPKRITRQQ